MAAAGIHVIMFDSGSKSDRAAAEIMIDNFESGRSAFFALRELTNEKIVAGIVSPYEQTGNGAERVNGFLSARARGRERGDRSNGKRCVEYRRRGFARRRNA